MVSVEVRGGRKAAPVGGLWGTCRWGEVAVPRGYEGDRVHWVGRLLGLGMGMGMGTRPGGGC